MRGSVTFVDAHLRLSWMIHSAGIASKNAILYVSAVLTLCRVLLVTVPAIAQAGHAHEHDVPTAVDQTLECRHRDRESRGCRAPVLLGRLRDQRPGSGDQDPRSAPSCALRFTRTDGLHPD